MLQLKIRGKEIYSHVKGKYVSKTPEEIVRQTIVCGLVNKHGYLLEQIGEEVPISLPVKGERGKLRADIVVWDCKESKDNNNFALIVIECKSKKIELKEEHFFQCANYSSFLRTPFFVVTNGTEAHIFKNDRLQVKGNLIKINEIPRADKVTDIEYMKKILNNEIISNITEEEKIDIHGNVIKKKKPRTFKFIKKDFNERILTIIIKTTQLEQILLESLFDVGILFSYSGLTKIGTNFNLSSLTLTFLLCEYSNFNLFEKDILKLILRIINIFQVENKTKREFTLNELGLNKKTFPMLLGIDRFSRKLNNSNFRIIGICSRNIKTLTTTINFELNNSIGEDKKELFLESFLRKINYQLKQM